MKVYWRKGHGTTAQLTSKYNKVLFKAPRHRNFTSVASCVCVCHHTHPISSDVLCDFLSTGPEFLAETWQWEKALEILHSGAIWGNGFSKDFLSTGWSFRCRLAQEKGNLRIKKNTRSSKPCSFASAANNCKNAKHANECQLISNNLNQWMLSELSNTDIHWSGGAKKVQGQDPAVRWLWPPDLQQGSFTVYTHIYHKYIYILCIDQKLLNQRRIISLLFDAFPLSQANPCHAECCWDRSSMHLARSWWEATLDSDVSSVSANNLTI
jgi:hypothetical protein